MHKLLGIFTCTVGSEQKAANKIVSSVSTDAIAFAAKNLQQLSKYVENIISWLIQYISYRKIHLVLL